MLGPFRKSLSTALRSSPAISDRRQSQLSHTRGRPATALSLFVRSRRLLTLRRAAGPVRDTGTRPHPAAMRVATLGGGVERRSYDFCCQRRRSFAGSTFG